MLNRREFLEAIGVSGAVLTLGFGGLQKLMADGSVTPSAGFGPLLPDPNKVLDLPKGFTYRIISQTGKPMADGLLSPGKQDGMAAFPGPHGRVILIRNHENEYPWRPLGPFGLLNERYAEIDHSKLYDVRQNNMPCIGGCSILVYNPKSGQVEKEFMRLLGTERNCAGGPTPWGTWITCEESSVKAGDGYKQDHGYAFEVSATLTPELEQAKPLKAMGRFRREAIAVDPATSIVYQTEDLGDASLYRFVPDKPEKLDSGKLQALVIKGGPADTRNNPGGSTQFPLNKSFEVDWVDLDDVEAPQDDLRFRAQKQGAAIFARTEGIWTGDDEIYFACTTGGPQMFGQIFRLVPGRGEKPDTLELFIESHDSDLMQNADNLVVAPWGDVIICEDSNAPHKRLVGVTPKGEIYHLAKCMYNSSELAGACFSPDGKTLFFNIQNAPGLTIAMTGPWPTA
ncbi:alkaline phosphatase PhoX [Cerasicoccus maritimus]|uniref:alkaline phosphatase PhoX n=1 Tax=Cerasicoccus maritimus TaxID=490089 RepID=UPI0028528112|nr:alkaline phosphatase PhoX [Cerasicoccus maritimus]